MLRNFTLGFTPVFKESIVTNAPKVLHTMRRGSALESMILDENGKRFDIIFDVGDDRIFAKVNGQHFGVIDIFGYCGIDKRRMPENIAIIVEKAMLAVAKAIPKPKKVTMSARMKKAAIFNSDGCYLFELLEKLDFKKSQNVHLSPPGARDRIFLVRDKNRKRFVVLLSHMIREEYIFINLP